MGYRFDPDSLDVLDADVYLSIANMYAKEESEAMKRNSKASGKKAKRK